MSSTCLFPDSTPTDAREAAGVGGDEVNRYDRSDSCVCAARRVVP